MIAGHRVQPLKRGLDGRGPVATGLFRPGDHDHGEAELASRCELGGGGISAGVLRDDNFDSGVPEQRFLFRCAERAAPEQQLRMGRQILPIRRLDGAYEITMLGRGLESGDLLTADGEENAGRPLTESERSLLQASGLDPAIAGLRVPGRTDEGEQRKPRRLRRRDRVLRDPRGEGMGGIHQGGDVLSGQPLGEACRTAEPADAARNRLSRGRCGASGQGKDRRKTEIAREALGQGVGFRGAAENEDSHGRL